MKTKYVFIVGLPRTGTKLIKNILQCSQHVRCKISPETWFFGDLVRPGIKQIIKKIGPMSDDENIYRLVEHLCSGKFNRTYWKLLSQGALGVDKAVLLHNMLECNRSEKAIYNAILNTLIENENDTIEEDEIIIGDKTPGHLYHVPTLISWFPEAKIIHTFRDPRAIMASEWKRLMDQRKKNWLFKIVNPLYSLVIAIYITFPWLYAVRLHNVYKERYPDNYLLSRYEDVINDPEDSIKRLCDFIELEFDEKMLYPAKFGSSFENSGGRGFYSDGIYRWRMHLKPWMRVWMSFWTKRFLKKFGYFS